MPISASYNCSQQQPPFKNPPMFVNNFVLTLNFFTMNFLSNILTIVLVSLFTINATASTTFSLEMVESKKEIVAMDDNSNESFEYNNELQLTNLELSSDIVNKVKPTQLEVQAQSEVQSTTILLSFDTNDKIDHTPALN